MRDCQPADTGIAPSLETVIGHGLLPFILGEMQEKMTFQMFSKLLANRPRKLIKAGSACTGLHIDPRLTLQYFFVFGCGLGGIAISVFGNQLSKFKDGLVLASISRCCGWPEQCIEHVFGCEKLPWKRFSGL
jgi:hypothetical protein